MALDPRSSLVALTLCATLAGGCAPRVAHDAASADLAAATADESDPSRLPASLEELELSASQRRDILALRDSLKQRLEPLKDAGRDVTLAIATTARRCDGSTMALDDASSWAVRVGEGERDAILDAIDELHRILSPIQRRALVKRILFREEQSRSQDSTDDGARSLGDVLDLSVGQILTVISRGAALKDELEERLEPWRDELKVALAAFLEDDFAIRDQDIARVPAFALATRFVRDAVRTLLPILEPEQCQALADFIEEEVKKAERDEPR